MSEKSIICGEGKTATSINAFGETGQPHAKQWYWTVFLQHIQRQNGKRVKCKTWNHKIRTGKYRQYILFHLLCPRDFFLDMFPQARVRKAKINGTMSNKTTFVQPKKPSKWKGSLLYGRRYFVNNILGKGLIFKLYQEILQPNIKKNKQSNLKLQRTWTVISPKDKKIAKKHMIKVLNITNYQENRKPMCCHLTSLRMTIIKKTRNNYWWEECGAKGTLIHCCWSCKFKELL